MEEGLRNVLVEVAWRGKKFRAPREKKTEKFKVPTSSETGITI
jgi:hypothetical protein